MTLESYNVNLRCIQKSKLQIFMNLNTQLDTHLILSSKPLIT